MIMITTQVCDQRARRNRFLYAASTHQLLGSWRQNSVKERLLPGCAAVDCFLRHFGNRSRATRTEEAQATPRSLRSWLMKGVREEHQAHLAPHPSPQQTEKTHGWWQVMCLTGVDYFSTLGYQPGIAALAAGAISPIATVVLVALTLLGALPVYRRVAESPNGEGSIAMLERLMSFWKGKIFVLALLGFAATDFIITMTLSAADATAHLVENPHLEPFLAGHQVAVTLFPLALLGAVFLRGFKEAVGVAVALVAVYRPQYRRHHRRFGQVAAQPILWSEWSTALTQQHGNPLVIVGIALLVFPKLALGLSGFETGVAVMPHINGDPDDTPAHPMGRIRGAKKLLTTAALIMSVFLITSSVVTTLLIPPAEFQPGGSANGRALAYLAHEYLGSTFGSARVNDRDLVVRRRIRDGWSTELDPALPAPLRHGSSLGAGRSSPGVDPHLGRFSHHDHLSRRTLMPRAAPMPPGFSS
jgi:hypothetical protein